MGLQYYPYQVIDCFYSIDRREKTPNSSDKGLLCPSKPTVKFSWCRGKSPLKENSK
jgi:hypothetical protein